MFLPFRGAPPSNLGASHVMVAVSSPTEMHFTFSGGSGTSESNMVRRKGYKKHATESRQSFPGRSSLTYDLDEQHGLVLAGGVVDADCVVALILPLRTLNDEAAQILPRLHPDAALRVADYLVMVRLHIRLGSREIKVMGV